MKTLMTILNYNKANEEITEVLTLQDGKELHMERDNKDYVTIYANDWTGNYFIISQELINRLKSI